MRMLYSQRKAMAAMPRVWRPVHRFLWWIYWPWARFRWARWAWGQYRRTWP